MVVVVTLDPKVVKHATRCLNKLKRIIRRKWLARDEPCMRFYRYECNQENSERANTDGKKGYEDLHCQKLRLLKLT